MVICLAYLILEDDNPHDSQAVRVEIKGQKVGYLARDYAPSYRSIIDGLPAYIEEVSVAAAITNGQRFGTKTYEYTVELDIPDSLKLFPLTERMDDELSTSPGYTSLERSDDGSLRAKVWIPVADFSLLDRGLEVDTWTTPEWSTVNFYVSNRQRIGLGYKIYELPKPEYQALLGGRESTLSLVVNGTRFAEFVITAVPP
jgi:hypothetical protein